MIEADRAPTLHGSPRRRALLNRAEAPRAQGTADVTLRTRRRPVVFVGNSVSTLRGRATLVPQGLPFGVDFLPRRGVR